MPSFNISNDLIQRTADIMSVPVNYRVIYDYGVRTDSQPNYIGIAAINVTAAAPSFL